MAESNSENTGRLTDWIILIFVLVVMSLLIVDLGSNVVGTSERDRQPESGYVATPTS